MVARRVGERGECQRAHGAKRNTGSQKKEFNGQYGTEIRGRGTPVLFLHKGEGRGTIAVQRWRTGEDRGQSETPPYIENR